MSDLHLLLFGCVVSFIAAAGAYVYIREFFTMEEQPSDLPAQSQDPVKQKIREVA